jgi:hypothetical protein
VVAPAILLALSAARRAGQRTGPGPAS